MTKEPMRETCQMPDRGAVAPTAPATGARRSERTDRGDRDGPGPVGNDQHIRTMLQDLARVAGIQVLMPLRRRLYDGLR